MEEIKKGKELTKFELANIKRLYKNIVPTLRKIEKLDSNINKLQEEKEILTESIKKTEDLMLDYTGGVDYKAILFPEEIKGVVVEEVPMCELSKEENLIEGESLIEGDDSINSTNPFINGTSVVVQ